MSKKSEAATPSLYLNSLSGGNCGSSSLEVVLRPAGADTPLPSDGWRRDECGAISMQGERGARVLVGAGEPQTGAQAGRDGGGTETTETTQA